jgi:hypothetical protein
MAVLAMVLLVAAGGFVTFSFCDPLKSGETRKSPGS